MDILSTIAANRRLEIDDLKLTLPLERIRGHLPDIPAHRFRQALSAPGISIIGEVKKASPSRGVLREDFDPEDLARQYAEGGAAALSVLTESRHFHGRFENLAAARKACDLPLLCKDFVVDPYHVTLARYHGADAVLLIVRLLAAASLRRLLECADELGMDCLVEVHDEHELRTAIECRAPIVGVNCRNLEDFTVDLAVAERLAQLMPEGVVRVAESGIHSRGDVARLRASGFGCFLIGEALVRAENPAALIEELARP